MKKIVKNEILFTNVLKSDRNIKMSLNKQTYSDGTSFYTLEDKDGNWELRHGSNSIDDLIESMLKDIKKDLLIKEKNSVNENPDVHEIYNQIINWKYTILDNIKLIAQ